MTIIAEPPELVEADKQPLTTPTPETPNIPEPTPPTQTTLRRGRVALAAGLASAAGAWVLAHLFHAVFPALLAGGLGCVLGAGGIAIAQRTRSTVTQYLVLPVSLICGAVLTVLGAGGDGSLPTLVNQALHEGGLRNPPVPFDPGWRFLLVFLFASLAALATTVATATNRPKLAVGVPATVVVLGTVLQSKGGQLAPIVGAVILLVAAMGVAYGAELADQVGAGARFETRRLVRGAALLVVAVAALVGVAQSNFLFPATQQHAVIPPRKPPSAPPLPPDEKLFSVTSAAPVPWRLGVLDSYGQNAFLLPSVDDARMTHVRGSLTLPAPPGLPTFTATVTVQGLRGQVLPAPGGLTQLSGARGDSAYDPETGLVQHRADDLRSNETYTVTATDPPSAAQLRTVTGDDPALDVYTKLPAPPATVQALLDKAPARPLFDRLQVVRLALLSKVVADGSGGARDITPDDVSSMMNGGSATPYQIVAAQVMLARWAGIPARVGYGFYGGTVTGGTTQFTPTDGSAWLEADFGKFGWIPIVGTPQQATPQLTKQQQKTSSAKQSNQLALSLYIPVREFTPQLLYTLVRYYAVRVLGIGIPVALVVVCYPVLFKSWRRRRRSRWARREGPRGRVIAAYADLRDRCYDLNIGDPRATPLQFLTSVAPDREHEELAWLVTRAVWGDLARDLREDDVHEAEEMARSVARRISMEQTAINRFVAAVTRTSLRDPWSDELPNLWRRHTRRKRRLAVAATAVAAVTALAGCGGSTTGQGATQSLPSTVIPAALTGYQISRQPALSQQLMKHRPQSLVDSGDVYVIRSGATVDGSLQVSLFKPGVNGQDSSIQRDIEQALDSSGQGFQVEHLGIAKVLIAQTGNVSLSLWFPPEHNVMEVFVMRTGFADAGRLVHAIVDYQLGIGPTPADLTPVGGVA